MLSASGHSMFRTALGVEIGSDWRLKMQHAFEHVERILLGPARLDLLRLTRLASSLGIHEGLGSGQGTHHSRARFCCGLWKLGADAGHRGTIVM